MTMTVQVSDSDESGDISAVYQITQNGTHYQLTDDGNGSYSRTITWIPSILQRVKYDLLVHRYDKSQTMSNVVTDNTGGHAMIKIRHIFFSAWCRFVVYAPAYNEIHTLLCRFVRFRYSNLLPAFVNYHQ